MEGNNKKKRKKVKSRRTQIPNEKKFKLEKDLSNSRRMRGKGIDRERSLVLIRRSRLDLHMLGKKKNLLL